MLLLLPLAMGCSSSSKTPGDGSGGGGNAGGAGGGGTGDNTAVQPTYPTGGVVVGSGNGTTNVGAAYVEGSNPKALPLNTTGKCPSVTGTHQTAGSKVTVPVTWDSSPAFNQGSGVSIFWLLSEGDVDANGKLTGTQTNCAIDSPPQELTPVAAQTQSAATGAKIWALTPNSVWGSTASGSNEPVAPVSGTWPVDPQAGTTVTWDPKLVITGLKPTSMYALEATTWPTNQAYLIPQDDLADVEGDGKKGWTSQFDHSPGYVDGLGDVANLVYIDQVYVVGRNKFALSGEIQPNCVEIKGTVDVQTNDHSVVGCHHREGGADCSAGTASSEAATADGFTSPFNASKGTFVVRQFQKGATCADVLAVLP
jgi:hypothetical protein